MHLFQLQNYLVGTPTKHTHSNHILKDSSLIHNQAKGLCLHWLGLRWFGLLVQLINVAFVGDASPFIPL